MDSDEEGNSAIVIDVKRTGVTDGFTVYMPVRFEFGKQEAASAILSLDADEKTFTFRVPRKPSKVVFNPGHAVLARVKQ
jgi:hypothetical protein